MKTETLHNTARGIGSFLEEVLLLLLKRGIEVACVRSGNERNASSNKIMTDITETNSAIHTVF